MARPLTPIVLSPDEKKHLLGWKRKPRSQHRHAERVQIILWAAQGLSNKEIAARLETREARVSKWRVRFAQEGLSGLLDDWRPGRPPIEDEEEFRARLLAQLDEPPPAGFACWNGGLLAKALASSADRVWRVLRKLGISLQRRRSWCISTDPQFAQKAADVVGLYLAPPQGAVVLSVDEKPCIQALERAQGWLRLPDGRALTGFAHEYKRHGTTTLFAALNVLTGQVQAQHYKRKRRIEFLDFMDQVVAAHPGKELHVIVDNLSIHLVDKEPWKKAHPQVHFHFTPTHASWLNQVEVWFSILTRQALRGASFGHVKELIAAIEAFIQAYNATAHPFAWTKLKVTPKSLESKYANLFN
jgi:transposase